MSRAWCEVFATVVTAAAALPLSTPGKRRTQATPIGWWNWGECPFKFGELEIF
jgi:hypothetical protein